MKKIFALIGFVLGYAYIRTITPDGPWASIPMNKQVGGALFSKPWQIVGGKRWSLTLHTSMKPYRLHKAGEGVRFTIREDDEETA